MTEATRDLIEQLSDIVKKMLEAHDYTVRGRETRRGEAVIAGQRKHDRDSEPERVGVLADPGDICLVILSKALAEVYEVNGSARDVGGSEPGVVRGGASALLESPPTFQMPSANEIRARTGGGRSPGLCVWDPITGEHHCTD